MPFASCGKRNLSRIIPYPAIGINDQGRIIGTGYNATGQVARTGGIAFVGQSAV